MCRGNASTSPWTRAQDVEYYTSPDWFDYYRCASCDVAFLNPLPVERLAESYPPNYYSYAAARRSLVQRVKTFLDRRYLRRILRQIDGVALSVLDIGGGTGQILDIVRRADLRVRTTHIVDLNEGAEAAAHAGGHGFTRCRIEEFSSPACFDLILLLNLIEHVEDPLAVLSKTAALLAPGGRAIIKTPNMDSLDARLFRHQSWGGYHCPRHWTLFTPESFSAAAARAGLKIKRLSFTQGAPFWAISVFEVLRKQGLVAASGRAPAPFHPLIPVLQAAFAIFDLLRSPFSRTSQMFVEMSVDQEHAS